MAKIEMSPDFASGYVTRMISLNTGTTYLNSSGLTYYGMASGNGLLSHAEIYSSLHVMTQTQLFIMKGVKPIDFTGLTKYEDRSADVLAQFSVNQSHFVMTKSGNVATISTTYNNASSSGLATWFWLITRQWNYYTGYYANTLLIHQTMGTIGLPGTSSDLELQDTNIVSGQPYRILNLGLRFPTSWTF